MANFYSSLTGQQIEAALKIAKKIGQIDGLIQSNGSGSDSGITAGQGGGGGSDNVFVATYGVTSLASIQTAIQAGKLIVVDLNLSGRRIYGIMDVPKISGDPYRVMALYSVNGSRPNVYYGELSQAGTWSTLISESAVVTDDQVGIINASSTHSGYPTPKAVWDLVQGGGGNTGVFVAEYGVTTTAEIDQAIDDGKLIFVNKPSTDSGPQFGIYIGEGFGHMFSVVGYGGYYMCSVIDDEWDSDDFTHFLYTRDIATSVTSSGTDYKVPSVKAVWNLFQTAGSNIFASVNMTGLVYSDITSILNSGKIPVLIRNSGTIHGWAIYTGTANIMNPSTHEVTQNCYCFSGFGYYGRLSTDPASTWNPSLKPDSTWFGDGVLLEHTDSVNSTSSSSSFPSAKAVWDLVSPLKDELNGVNSLVGTGVI